MDQIQERQVLIVTRLRFKKHNFIHILFNTNTKKLYKTIMEITSKNKKNPLPE